MQVRDFRVVTRQGNIFVRHWRPAGGSEARPPIVLFHDSLGCVETWREFPQRLACATGCTIIAYDRLGFGRSDPRHDVPSSAFVREEARTGFEPLRQALALEHFIAFGHSVGGGMAIACAAVNPTQCRAVVTESAQAFVEERTLQGIRDAERTFARPGQMQRLEKYHGEKAAWVLHAWVDSWLAAEFRSWNLDQELRSLRCPLLAIQGDDDEYGSSDHARRLVELAAASSTLCILPGCGHVPHREKEALVLEEMRDWLASI
jgi:pimeloyl-ACP methyl ester carboxylesterase